LHELSIAANILDIVLNEISSGNYKRITGLDIIIGDLSGVVGDNVKYYFEMLSRDTPAWDATMTFEYKKSKFRCNSCEKIYERDSFSILCPYCNSGGTVVESYTSLYIESIEVE